MKKQEKTKKLSLKKVQVMKINEQKNTNGGNIEPPIGASFKTLSGTK